MKQIVGLLSLLATMASCGNSKLKEKTAADNIVVSSTVSQAVGIGKIEPENNIIQLSSPVTGIVQSILKKENDTVFKGTPILELDHLLEDGRVKQLKAEVNAQANQIKVDEASIGEYEAKYNNAISEVQRLQRLLEMGAETQQVVDDANTVVKSYEANLKRLQAIVTVSKSKLEQTKATLGVAEIEREKRIIASPVDGRILEVSALVGSSVDTRQSCAQISPLGKIIAVCEIDEMYADKVSVGQKAWIRNVGKQDTLSTGTVYLAYSFLQKKSLFTDQSGEKEDRRVRTIKIMLDHPDRLLLNARVECVVDISGELKKMK